MGITLPLEQMSTEEKIQTMEAIWDDLYKKADSLSSPSWHEDILHEMEERIKNHLKRLQPYVICLKNSWGQISNLLPEKVLGLILDPTY